MFDGNTVWRYLGLAVSVVFAASPAWAFDYELYASIRVQAEAVSPDNQEAMDSYTGLRDAYSRVGFKASHAMTDGAMVYTQVELPLDVPNLAVQDPWDQTEHLRIAQVGIRGVLGDLAVGQVWMPYYNAIAYPVDMFSSYYSGFATFTSFRLDNTLAYYTPKFGGFSVAAAYSYENGATDDDGSQDDRWQVTANYELGDLTLSGGLDHLGGESDSRIWGGSLMWQASDALYIGAKYELYDSNIKSGYGTNGDTAANLYAGYTLGSNTFQAMIANVDNYGDHVIHLGLAHQYNEDLSFFVEYYREQDTAAITTRGGGAAETCWACDGGHVFTAGLRYNFTTN